MRTNNIRISGFLLGGLLAAINSVNAAELKFGAADRAIRNSAGDTIEVQRLPLDPDAPNNAIKMEPLRVHMDETIVRDGAGGVTAAAEKLIYNNSIGSFVLALQFNQVVADDITVVARSGCNLRRYSFSVVGRANPAGAGGAYSITYALYNNCPGAGGPGAQPIPGTEGVVNFVDDSVINTVEKVIPDGTIIALPPTVWLGLKPSRSNVGVIGGAPAFVGFSADIVDFPGSACNGDAGKFPLNPHASFKASVWGDASCADAFPVYRNLSPGASGFNPGSQQCIADDLQLLTDNCLLVGYDVGVRLTTQASASTFRLRLHQDAGGLPGAEIPGTNRNALISTGQGGYAIRVSLAAPVQINTDRIWITLDSTNAGGGWILTRRNASIGNTNGTFAKSESGKKCVDMLTAPDWVSQSPADATAHGGFEATVYCSGQAPVGACCDMYLTDDGACSNGFCVRGEFDGLECFADIDCKGDPMCREVPFINCSFPLAGTGFRPAWQPGASCRKCTGGANDGLTCTSAGDCPGGTCSGISPFGGNTPCGVAACCKPDDSCENLTEKQCAVAEPPYEPNKRQWQIGRFCGDQGQRCPRIVCLGREGSCTAPRDRLCEVGGVINETICTNDNECKAFCGNPRCVGGPNGGQVCGQPGDCPDGLCRQRCIGGSNNGIFCVADTECNDDGACEPWDVFDPTLSRCVGGTNDGLLCDFNFECPGGVCTPTRCDGGSRSGRVCTEDRECADAFCSTSPGCENPLCCTAVCDLEFQRFGTTLCCDFHWLPICTTLAADQANVGDCFLSAENDACRPDERSDGATSIALGGTLEVPMKGSMHTLGVEPGYCCHNGVQDHCVRAGVPSEDLCVENADCFDIQCRRICQGGPSNGNPCSDFKRCFNFTSFLFGELCTLDADCAAGETCESPQCFDQSLNGVGKCSNPICNNGAADPIACNTEADCNTNRICQPRTRQPGAPAAGTLWFRFTVPPGPTPVDVVVNTCRSTNSGARDSMLQVFSAVDPDLGVCQDLGHCANGDPCNLAAPTCADASTCVAQRTTCSIAEQDCLLDRPCVVDLLTQCNALVLLGCNDDDVGGCAAEGHADRPGNAKLCVPDLVPGQTYFVEMGHKGSDRTFDDTDGVYRLDITATGSCPGTTELNDSCPNALVVGNGTFPFNLDNATFDCPAPACLPGSGRDVWFRYTAPQTGTAVFSTCGLDAPSTPNTEMALYNTCECPSVNSVIPAFKCSGIVGGACDEGSLIQTDVQAGECYLVRIGDRSFIGGSGSLKITTLSEDCNSNGVEDICDTDCDAPGCLVSGCGQSVDCNNNQIPDECEEDTGCCPSGAVTFTSPIPGVIDAGWPLNPQAPGVPLGITTIQVNAPAGAGPDCWDLCETATTGTPNGLTVTDHGDGTYTLTLDRPITPGACTTITFLAGDGSKPFANFRSHPANVDANGLSNGGDVQALVNLLNGIGVPVYGLYSMDVNRSGAANAADILALIDTLNGAGALTVWNNTALPACAICQPTQ